MDVHRSFVRMPFTAMSSTVPTPPPSVQIRVLDVLTKVRPLELAQSGSVGQEDASNQGLV